MSQLVIVYKCIVVLQNSISWLLDKKMYFLKIIVFLTFLHVVSVKSGKVCSVLEHREMQTDFTNCSRRYTDEHFNTEDWDTCHLVKSVVGKCGDLWERCHSNREVRRMRDLHIEALVRQYGSEGGLDGCDLVRKYRQSGRTPDDPIEEVTCSDTKTMDIQTKFQTCSHSTATSVYQTIQDLTNVKIISDKLCKALTTIGTVCVKHLNECFAEDDVRQMRKSHLEEMKTFLLRISQGKVTNNAFDSCKVLEYVENETDKDEDQEDNIIVSNTNEQNILGETKYVPSPANNVQELKNITTAPGHQDDLLPKDTIEEGKQEQGIDSKIAPFQEKVSNEQNENINYHEKVKKVAKLSSFKELKVKGARSAEFSETDSAPFEFKVKTENTRKDDIVNKLNETEPATKKTEAADAIVPDMNDQAVTSGEEGERLQQRLSAGGVSRADSQAITVVVSFICMVVMNRS